MFHQNLPQYKIGYSQTLDIYLVFSTHCLMDYRPECDRFEIVLQPVKQEIDMPIRRANKLMG